MGIVLFRSRCRAVSSPPPASKHTHRWFGWIATSIIASGSIAAIAFIYNAIHVSLEAERTHHASDLVLEVLTDFVRHHHNQWPRAWEELATTAQRTSANGFRWPDDIEKLKSRVKIEFALTAADVARMEVDSFTAVEPIGPNYGKHEGRINELLSAVRSGQRDITER
jgi:hypothetical protein